MPDEAGEEVTQMEYSKASPCWCDCIGGGNGGYCKLPPNSCGDCPARIAQVEGRLPYED